MVFKKENVLVNQNFKNKDELFTFIAKKAVDKKIALNVEEVKKGFEKRESEGTTGFEDGFAIPHARIQNVQEPSVFVITNKEKFSDWDSLDAQGVQYAIALLIPESSSSLHMEVLSTIATKLMDEEFRKTIKDQDQTKIFSLFNSFLNKKESKEEKNNSSQKLVQDATKVTKKIVGISACPAGIAHTFMAKQKMENVAKELDYQISWETQGANGQQNKLTDKQIKEADVVIIASDIDIDLKRFIGKKLLYTTTNDAIKNGSKLIERSLKEAKKYDGQKNYKNDINNKFTRFFTNYRKAFQSNFGKPWTYLFLTSGFLAIISLIGFSFYGQEWTENGLYLNKVLFQIQEIAKFILYLSMPFMAGFVAKSVTKKDNAFVLAFAGTLLINLHQIQIGYNSITNYQQQPLSLFYDWNGLIPSENIHGSNVLGALVVTFVTILFTNLFEKFINNFENAKSLFLKQLSHNWIVRTFFVALVLLVTVFLLGAPLSFVSSKIFWLFFTYGNQHWWIRFLIGGFFGALITLDLGGFVNKTTLIALIGFAQYDLRFTAVISIGIPICSLGLGATFHFFKSKFKKEDINEGKTSFRKGLNGISEGPLALLIKYKWRVYLPNFFASFIATGTAMVLGIYVLSGGHINILFLGGQAHLAQINDISFLNELLPRGKHILTILSSFLYGIIGYYLCMVLGVFTYVGVSYITFNLPGVNPVFMKGN